jgi:hypothetical protein
MKKSWSFVEWISNVKFESFFAAENCQDKTMICWETLKMNYSISFVSLSASKAFKFLIIKIIFITFCDLDKFSETKLIFPLYRNQKNTVCFIRARSVKSLTLKFGTLVNKLIRTEVLHFYELLIFYFTKLSSLGIYEPWCSIGGDFVYW